MPLELPCESMPEIVTATLAAIERSPPPSGGAKGTVGDPRTLRKGHCPYRQIDVRRPAGSQGFRTDDSVLTDVQHRSDDLDSACIAAARGAIHQGARQPVRPYAADRKTLRRKDRQVASITGCSIGAARNRAAAQ